MFREMRRKKQAMTTEEIKAVLHRGTSGVLALSGDDDYPYAVPISYVYDGEKLYFHCAREGHKLDAVKRSRRASFCIIDQDLVAPKEYTSYYRSVILFGQIRVLEQEQEKLAAIEKLAVKYAPEDSDAERQAVIERWWNPLCMLEMSIVHMSGKEAMELREGSC